jgi:hypothetical protein
VQAVHGPADLSFLDVARIITAVTGHHIEAVQLRDEDVASALTSIGMPPAVVEGLVAIARGLREGFRPVDARSPATTTPTSLAEWVVANRAELGLGPDGMPPAGS